MNLTAASRHANTRCQQRGLSPLVVDCLLQFGEEVYDHAGGVIHHFTKKSLRRIEHTWGREPVRRLLHDHRDAYVVTSSSDGTIITTGWRDRRIPR